MMESIPVYVVMDHADNGAFVYGVFYTLAEAKAYQADIVSDGHEEAYIQGSTLHAYDEAK
jgi:hypothetical protein